MSSWNQAFESRTDLKPYGDSSLGLFALALRFSLDDLASVAADAVTDGSDDKKCDLIHIDRDDGHAVIAQCFLADRRKPSAPSNKASDLNTAIAWLLQRPIDQLPKRIKPAATELRQAIEDDAITTIHLWYVHNLPESKNVKQELLTVEQTTEAAIQNQFSDKRVIIQSQEVGEETLEEWYTDTQSPILVSESFDIPIPAGFEMVGEKWKAYVTVLPGKFLYSAYKKYSTKLFSANVRDYLGSRRSDANINNGIKRSAQDKPPDFWVFNNGLTILVHSYRVSDDKLSLHIDGLSIVNGAQTTGAIGSLTRSPRDALLVPVRFVVTNDKDTIFDIIQYNNSQNKVTASDFRSRDRIQRRLGDEITIIPQAEYQGGRRGGASDLIRRNTNLLPSYTVGQALAAVQLEPDIAYNQKLNIWASDTLYARFFNENTSGAHIVFAFSLLRCVEARKAKLIEKSKAMNDSLTEAEEKELEYFRERGPLTC